MDDNWNELTAHLRDATILVLTGRHGNESGSIGPAEDFLTKEQIQQVRPTPSFPFLPIFLIFEFVMLSRMRFW